MLSAGADTEEASQTKIRRFAQSTAAAREVIQGGEGGGGRQHPSSENPFSARQKAPLALAALREGGCRGAVARLLVILPIKKLKRKEKTRKVDNRNKFKKKSVDKNVGFEYNIIYIIHGYGCRPRLAPPPVLF